MQVRQRALILGILLLLAATLTAQEPPRPYTGEPISLDLKEVDLLDFFRLIHEISGLNIVVEPGVRGTLTLVLIDVPWDRALDVVLKNHGLVTELQNNLLRVMTRETAKKEQEARTQLAQAVQAAVPRRTVAYRLRYAHAADLAEILRRFLSPRGEIAVDERTNTLIISDVPAALDQLLGPHSRPEPSQRSPRGQLPEKSRPPRPRYVLALKDGIDYGVYSCEVRGAWLRYHTTYGARAWLPVERVDWLRTNCAAQSLLGK